MFNVSLTRYNYTFLPPGYSFFSLIYKLTISLLLFLIQYSFLSHLASNGGHGSTSNAFIFSLINKEGLAPFKSMVKRTQYAIYRSSSYGPIFSGGNDILISNNANSNANSYTNFGSSYSAPSGVQDRRTILAGTNRFTPDEVEVSCDSAESHDKETRQLLKYQLFLHISFIDFLYVAVLNFLYKIFCYQEQTEGALP